MGDHLRNAESLLDQISDALKALSGRETIGSLEVDFIKPDGEKFTFDLSEALGNIANDIYWNEMGSWAEASKVEVRVL